MKGSPLADFTCQLELPNGLKDSPLPGSANCHPKWLVEMVTLEAIWFVEMVTLEAILFQPATNQAKWSSRKSVRGGVVIRDFLGL